MKSSRLLHALLLLGSASHLDAAVFTVDTTSDVSLTACIAATADCSLRGAVAAAQSAAGSDTVAFNIPTSDSGCVAATGVCTIRPTSALVVFGGGPLIIDGTTQPGWQANTNTPAQGGINAQLKIEIRGSTDIGAGFVVANPASAVRGLAIHGFGTQIAMDNGAGGSVVEGCFLGTDVTGSTIAVPGSQFGVHVNGNQFSGEAASGVRVGGTLPSQRNLISGNADAGVRLVGYSMQVLGNLIGTNATGTRALGNRTGVFMQGGGNINASFRYLIGDGTPEGRNVISGSSVNGILSSTGGPTSDTRIQGNFIGTDITGELPLGNGATGITTGLVTPSGNSGTAVLIGGTTAGQGNRISFNGASGIMLSQPKTAVLGNQMGGNGGLGISVLGTARHANDVNDADVGNNFMPLQNFPAISAFAVAGGNVDMSYRVDSTPANSVYPLRVEFFKADGDEGRDFLGADEYTAAQAQTVKAISLPIPGGVTLTANDVIVGTATDAAGNTSEFSFSPATLAIATPTASPCTSTDSVFCNSFEPGPQQSLLVRVGATATSGPFAPNGVVNVTDNRGGSCNLTLLPVVTPALSSEGSCILVNSGVAGAIAITATLNTFRSAFGSADGGNVVAIGNFIIE